MLVKHRYRAKIFRAQRWWLPAVCVLFLSGCQLMDAGRKMTSYTKNTFSPSHNDYRDTSQDADDDWGFVGQEARGDRPRERDPDPWWQQFVMSPRARSIEKNLGID